ncbi:tripartite tricarboxylate transporter substrate binding protein [Polynucleobacter sp. 78F-HAINBA]|uniref:Bug family tripartite tricarboxylate transporter substrate binding protein n=1 Tax=Polynucleobacter sp. 78F-HAINBA TaxID=2689099 RepID=UPI001C0C3824|nr:tripartite tricarboxylate transporter substrate binding protein [Polynucleobacter sp. 78F-HAINBA]MBU3590442.1 tripartite tricarboxylate transporter substrate binding protein [Polynucleobacter sp. 78F-HAINBA]
MGGANANAQEWPSKPIRWIVPFPPGGAMDVIARALADKSSKSLGQAIIVENKPGAGGNIGAELVARSDADGYTMIITSIGMATNKFLYPKLPYDPVKDFSPVSLVAVVPNVLVTNATQPNVKTVSDVIANAKAQPGRLTYASAGNGTSIHLAGEVFTSLAKIDMQHIPYKGSGPAVTDLIGGQVNYMFDSITSAKPHIASGKIRAIGLTTTKRSKSLPGVPTIAESGLPGYDVTPWFAVFVPSGTPAPIIKKLNKALVSSLESPEIKEKFENIGAEPVGSSPEETAKYLNKEIERWGKVISTNGIKAD